MPIYEFECECGHVFELLLSIKAGDVLQFCPKCWRPCKKNINFQGTTLTDEAPWVRETAGHLSNPECIDGKVPDNRSGLMRYMKDKGLEFKDKSIRGVYTV